MTLLAQSSFQLDTGNVIQLLLATAGAVWMVASIRSTTRELRKEITGLRKAVSTLAGRRLDERMTRCEALLERGGLGRPLMYDREHPQVEHDEWPYVDDDDEP